MIQQDLFTYSVAVQSIFDKWPILILEFIHRMVVIIYETVGVWGSGGKGQTIGERSSSKRIALRISGDFFLAGDLILWL